MRPGSPPRSKKLLRGRGRERRVLGPGADKASRPQDADGCKAVICFAALLKFEVGHLGEFVLAVLTALTVVVFGVEQGIMLAAVLSLLEHVRHSYRPHIGVMVRDAAGTWRLEEPVPDKMAEPGLVMFGFGRDLFCANVAFFAE